MESISLPESVTVVNQRVRLKIDGSEEKARDHIQKEEKSMLFHITQTHTPENCLKETGGSKTLYNPTVEGVKLLAMYGAFAQHVIYYIVEANSPNAIHMFLDPGFKSCTATITPVSEAPILR